MESPHLLTRPADAKVHGLPKWPFALAGLIFFVLLFVGNFFIDRSIPADGDIAIRKTTEPLPVSLNISKDAAPYPSGWSSYFDPTLMVLPNEQSYSRSYLLNSPNVPPATFDLAIQTPPYQFERPYFRTSGTVAPSRAGSWSKQDPPLLIETPAPAQTESLPLSVVGIYGGLQDRPILALPEFPRVTHPELLVPTEISIGVDGSGAVRMALLDKSCGDDAIDQHGLRLAREISFAPLASPSDRLVWGRLRICWSVELKANRP